MPKHPDDFRHTDLGEHPFDAQLERHLGSPPAPSRESSGEKLKGGAKPIHIDAATYDRERKRILVMGSVMIGSILLGMLMGLLFFCQGAQIRDRLEAQLYGERV